MARYHKIAQQEESDKVDEMLDVQIEELDRLKRYEYFWSGFNVLWCKSKDFWNIKLKYIYKIDQSISGIWRCLLYVLFMPFILIYLIFTLLK